MSETVVRPSMPSAQVADIVLALAGAATGFYGALLAIVSILGFVVLVPSLFLAGLVWAFPRLGPMRRRQVALWAGLVPVFVLTLVLYPTPDFY